MILNSDDIISNYKCLVSYKFHTVLHKHNMRLNERMIVYKHTIQTCHTNMSTYQIVITLTVLLNIS